MSDPIFSIHKIVPGLRSTPPADVGGGCPSTASRRRRPIPIGDLRSPHVRGRETGTIGKADYRLCRAYEVPRQRMLAGASRAQHPAAGVQYQLETLRSPPMRGQETGTIGKADYRLCRAYEVPRQRMLAGASRAQHPAAGVQYQSETLWSPPCSVRRPARSGKQIIDCAGLTKYPTSGYWQGLAEHSIPPQASNTNWRPCGHLTCAVGRPARSGINLSSRAKRSVPIPIGDLAVAPRARFARTRFQRWGASQDRHDRE